MEQHTDYQGPTFPLSFMKEDESGIIVSISGREETKRYLAGLGFIQGSGLKVIRSINGNVIVDVKGSRIATDATMASKIKCRPQ